MPFCPDCRFEYMPQLRQCPECGRELVATLPADPGPEGSHDFTQVELCTVTGEIHARLIQNVLATEGIPSRIVTTWPFENSSALSPPWPFGGGFDTTVRIMVNQSDLPRAKVIYHDFEETAGSADDTAALEDE
jgi:hypothetical protein